MKNVAANDAQTSQSDVFTKRFLGIHQIVGDRKNPSILPIIPIGQSTLWAWVKADKFPPPIKVYGRTVWREEDVYRWMDEQVSRNSNITVAA